MLKCFKNFDAKKTGLFAAGVLFGTIELTKNYKPCTQERSYSDTYDTI